MEELKNAYSCIDPSSCANPDEAIVSHIHLDWQLDFEAQLISGSALLTVKVVLENVTDVKLDSRGLTITRVSIGNNILTYALDEETSLGQMISISIPREYRTHGSTFDILIEYTI